MDDERRIARLRTAAIVGYTPLSDEPDFSSFLAAHGLKAPDVLVSRDRNADPFAAAEILTHRFSGQDAVLLIPGQAFDERGTRHGRGGGWYDRFLSRVPATWLRIGVVAEECVSESPLIRKSWDEPVDWLLVKGMEWSIIETGARSETPRAA